VVRRKSGWVSKESKNSHGTRAESEGPFPIERGFIQDWAIFNLAVQDFDLPVCARGNSFDERGSCQNGFEVVS